MSHKMRKTFTSSYEDRKDRDGCEFELLEIITEPTDRFGGVDAEVLPMYHIRLLCDGEDFLAWPEEVMEQA